MRTSINSIRKLCVLLIACVATLGAVSGPADRQPTDPKAVVSQTSSSARAVPIEDLYYSRRALSPSWSPDGKQVVLTTNFTGRLNLWKVSVDGGWPVQLLQSDDAQDRAVWSPDGQWIVFRQDIGGHEVYDLYAVPAGGGQAINLTNTPTVSEDSAVFSRDGSILAITSKPETSPVTNVAILDWRTHQIRELTNERTKDHKWEVAALSADGKYVFANRIKSSFADADVYRIEVQTGHLENLTAHQNDILYMAAGASPDGKTVLLHSTQRQGYQNVALLDVASKKLTWITDTQWEAEAHDFSPDGQHFSYTINADGRSMFYVQRVGAPTAEKLPFSTGRTNSQSVPTAFSPDGQKVLVLHQDSQRPTDVWVYELKSQSIRQLTYSALASLNRASIPPSQLVHYKTFDGQIISAYLWLPFNLKRDGSNPAIVIPHGGPTGQTEDLFDSRAVALASRGYICIAPNVRGSTGYGMAFQKANYQDLGGGDLEDEIYGSKFLIATGYVDAKKIGITGGSYGGFMTLMAIGKNPEVWAAAVELYGIIDWYTMLQHSDPFLQEYIKSLLGDPQKDRSIYEKSSPIKYIRSTTAPLLILQGETDIRVPKEESEQVANLLKQQGKVVDVHFYPAEGHGFAKRENQIDALRRAVEWFDKHLKRSIQ